MKPPLFKYYDATTVDEAVGLLAEHGEDAKVLAGGQSLIPMLSLRLAYPEALIDINGVDALDYVHANGGDVAIGALTRHVTLETSADVGSRVPLVQAAMPWVAHTAIRNRGTLGGTLAHADPAAELLAVATALGATLTARGPSGDREIPIESFFAMPLMSVLEPDELLTEVRLPAQPAGAGSAVHEIARRHGDFAVAGVVASLTVDGNTLRNVRLVGFATAPTPIRLEAAEGELDGVEIGDDALGAAGKAAMAAVSPTDDLHATAAYRRRVTAVLVERAVRSAIEDARRKSKEDQR